MTEPLKLSLFDQIHEAMAHPVGDDILITDPLALAVLSYVKDSLDFNLKTIIERDEARAEIERLTAIIIELGGNK